MKTQSLAGPLFLALTGLLSVAPSLALAAEELSAGETAWMLTSMLLVLMPKRTVKIRH